MIEIPMLRIAEDKDFEILKQMAKKFFDSSPYKDFPVQEEMFDNYIKSFLLPSVTKMIIISEESDKTPSGFLAFELGEYLFAPLLSAVEKAMWVEPEYRKGHVAKDLLGAFFFWAAKMQCPIIQLSSLTGEMEKTLDKFYKKMGFVKVENTYLRQPVVMKE